MNQTVIIYTAKRNACSMDQSSASFLGKTVENLFHVHTDRHALMTTTIAIDFGEDIVQHCTALKYTHSKYFPQ